MCSAEGLVIPWHRGPPPVASSRTTTLLTVYPTAIAARSAPHQAMKYCPPFFVSFSLCFFCQTHGCLCASLSLILAGVVKPLILSFILCVSIEKIVKEEEDLRGCLTWVLQERGIGFFFCSMLFFPSFFFQFVSRTTTFLACTIFSHCNCFYS